MTKLRIKLVKYDMDKTKKRSRKNLFVNDKTENDVIAQLEKIHKGEKVVIIHEIVWDVEQIEESIKKTEEKKSRLITGEVKFFDSDKGFGFIIPDDEDIEELFFYASAVSGEELRDYNEVEFEVSEGPKGPCAIHIKLLD